MAEVGRLHEDSLELDELVEPIRPRIKSILEHQRSSLDYLTVGVFDHLGTRRPPRKIYFPTAGNEAHLPRNFDANLPGVRLSYPEVFDAFAEHQPFRPEGVWLRWLAQLVNLNKHRALSLPTRQESEIWRAPGVKSQHVV